MLFIHEIKKRFYILIKMIELNYSSISTLSQSTNGVDSPSERLRFDSSAAISIVVSATKMSLEIILDVDEVPPIVTVVITNLISHSFSSSAPSIIMIVITRWLITFSSSVIAESVVVAQGSSSPPRHVQVAKVPSDPRQPRVLASVALSPASEDPSSESLVIEACASIGNCMPSSSPLL